MVLEELVSIRVAAKINIINYERSSRTENEVINNDSSTDGVGISNRIENKFMNKYVCEDTLEKMCLTDVGADAVGHVGDLRCVCKRVVGLFCVR